ncbi:DUF7114 family protein [Haloplanus aerogenes]|uniref:Polyprenyl synthetase n=1 Tax=Haloplanus aerogenes TaxID=660522 RepID=A0A3M0DRD1_9EURY|nr:hypothetical protein [Haloplanus aerogenes]AZH24182.1 hypothetical protein DU502_01785 [Haloplanus aerogenes]RMB24198.1 hypothetical protein ATH50_1439 [Haloplanus aerogenes]
MDNAVRARRAACDALADIEPERLREVLRDRLADASMTPSVLTLLSAHTLDPSVDAAPLAERAAGVQLIYEGLRLTRTLAHDEPWADGENDAARQADLDILAADVLVSRGFYLLARTETADRAVEVVRAFGRNQTRRRQADTDHETLDRNLEADVFALAVAAGTTAVGVAPGDELLDYADGLAREFEGDLPPPESALPDSTADRILALAGGDPAPSAADP